MSKQSNLDRLLTPYTPQVFWQDHWEKKPCLIERDDQNYYQDILTAEDLDILFQNQRLQADRDVSIVNRGQALAYSHWVQESSDRCTYLVDNNRLYSLLHQGNTVVVKGGHKYIPKLMAFCDRLKRELGFKLQTNIYLTPASAQGFAPHYDDHDVMILQLAGTKKWHLYHAPINLPTPKQKDLNPGQHQLDKPAMVVELKPGDLLYIPRGFIHEAFTTNTNSIHITLGLLPTYWFEILQQIVEQAQDNSRFRQAIPPQFANLEQQQQFSQEFQQLTQELITNLNPVQLVEQQYTKFLNQQLISNQGRFQNWLQIDRLNINSLVDRQENVTFSTEKNEDKIYLYCNQQQLTLPIFLSASLLTILQNQSFIIKDIGGLINDEGKIKLVKQLIEIGFLTIKQI